MSLRVVSLEYLGVVAARLRRDAVTSQLRTDTIDQLLKQVRDTNDNDSAEESKPKKHKKKKKADAEPDKEDASEDRIQVPYRVFIELFWLGLSSCVVPNFIEILHIFYRVLWDIMRFLLSFVECYPMKLMARCCCSCCSRCFWTTWPLTRSATRRYCTRGTFTWPSGTWRPPRMSVATATVKHDVFARESNLIVNNILTCSVFDLD